MFKALVFDLDDTLLDTTSQLVPQASRESCVAMVNAGLASDVETCMSVRRELASHNPRTDIYRGLVDRLGVRAGFEADVVADRGALAFFQRRVDPHIHLSSEILQMLERLKSRYPLYLVTAGAPETQRQKLKILKIESFFREIIIVDVLKNEKKRSAFARILQMLGCSPAEILSVGNRLDTDVGEARELGLKGCWVQYGEHRQLRPQTEFERPDFQVEDVLEIEKQCQL